MTKKHFIAMAEGFKATLALCVNQDTETGAKLAILAFCSVAKASNPEFQRERFLDACGYNASQYPGAKFDLSTKAA